MCDSTEDPGFFSFSTSSVFLGHRAKVVDHFESIATAIRSSEAFVKPSPGFRRTVFGSCVGGCHHVNIASHPFIFYGVKL